MKVSRRDIGDIRVLDIDGNLEGQGLEDLRTEFFEFVRKLSMIDDDNRPPKLLINLEKVEIIDDAGMRLLVEMRGTVNSKPGMFKLWNTNNIKDADVLQHLAMEFECVQGDEATVVYQFA